MLKKKGEKNPKTQETQNLPSAPQTPPLKGRQEKFILLTAELKRIPSWLP
ncbi:MAG: hypothetical protein Q4D26_00960 [Clostridia bacterium]|nr:hypothetical protein [Clostridia bacterium]